MWRFHFIVVLRRNGRGNQQRILSLKLFLVFDKNLEFLEVGITKFGRRRKPTEGFDALGINKSSESTHCKKSKQRGRIKLCRGQQGAKSRKHLIM